jgi:hypothetical protein
MDFVIEGPGTCCKCPTSRAIPRQSTPMMDNQCNKLPLHMADLFQVSFKHKGGRHPIKKWASTQPPDISGSVFFLFSSVTSKLRGLEVIF